MFFALSFGKRRSHGSHQELEIRPCHHPSTKEEHGRPIVIQHGSGRQDPSTRPSLARLEVECYTPKCIRMAGCKLRDSIRPAHSHVSAKYFERVPYSSGNGNLSKAESFGIKAFTARERDQERRQELGKDAAKQEPLPVPDPLISPNYSDSMKAAAQAQRDLHSAVCEARKEIAQLTDTQSKLERKSEIAQSHLMALAAKTPRTTEDSVALKGESQAANKQFEDLIKRLINVEIDLKGCKTSVQHFCEVHQRPDDPNGTPFVPVRLAPQWQQVPGQQGVRTKRSVVYDKRGGRMRDSNQTRDISFVQRHSERSSAASQRSPLKSTNQEVRRNSQLDQADGDQARIQSSSVHSSSSGSSNSSGSMHPGYTRKPPIPSRPNINLGKMPTKAYRCMLAKQKAEYPPEPPTLAQAKKTGEAKQYLAAAKEEHHSLVECDVFDLKHPPPGIDSRRGCKRRLKAFVKGKAKLLRHKGRIARKRFAQIFGINFDMSTSDLEREYKHAKKRLARAKWAFNLRDETRSQAAFENKAKLKRSKGAKGIPQEEFDVQWVDHISRLTRNLIDAEEHFRKTRLAAIRGGVSINGSEARSLFDNDRSEGYPPSWDEEVIADLPKEKIEEWVQALRTVSPHEEVNSVPSLSNLQEDDDLAPWDSTTATAEPREKRKIAQWTKICKSTGKAPARTGHHWDGDLVSREKRDCD